MTTKMRAHLTVVRAFLAGALVWGVSGAFAQNAILAVTGSSQGEVDAIRIEFARPLSALPTAFATQSPARIALDFPGVSGGMGRSNVDINQATVQSANIVQVDERSRVVLSLKRPASYSLQLVGNALIVSLEPQTNLAGVEQAKGLARAKICKDFLEFWGLRFDLTHR